MVRGEIEDLRAATRADVRVAELQTRISELESEAAIRIENIDQADGTAANFATKLEAEAMSRESAETRVEDTRIGAVAQAAAHEASLAASHALVADLRAKREQGARAPTACGSRGRECNGEATVAEDRAKWAIAGLARHHDEEDAHSVIVAASALQHTFILGRMIRSEGAFSTQPGLWITCRSRDPRCRKFMSGRDAYSPWSSWTGGSISFAIRTSDDLPHHPRCPC